METTQADILKRLKKCCADIINSPANSETNYGCDREKIFEIATLTTGFNYMELHRKNLMRAFERYESLKQDAKKKKAWSRVIDELYRLNS